MPFKDRLNNVPLPKEIEKLIKRGYLKEFVDKGDQREVPRQNRRSPQRDSHPRIKNEPPEAPLLTGHIDTITGSRVGGGDSQNSRKVYAHGDVYSIVERTTRKEEVISFNDKRLVGEVTLDFTVGEGTRISTIRVQFTMVDLEDSSYNGLIGRPILTALRAIVSPVHLKVKFPTPRGTGETCGDQKKAQICYQTSIPHWGRVKANREKSGVEKIT
ncbi:hypothetical protein LIER_19916 [Lithospermum erythrorhizon]|uniref:Uncharacterized protein n=1 Tax=Lithospermum erythrorhizon TaxID=34254 RepID=A0AAV3QKL5_LITER